MTKLIFDSRNALSALFPSLVENVVGCIGLICLAWALRARQSTGSRKGWRHDPLAN